MTRTEDSAATASVRTERLMFDGESPLSVPGRGTPYDQFVRAGHEGQQQRRIETIEGVPETAATALRELQSGLDGPHARTRSSYETRSRSRLPIRRRRWDMTSASATVRELIMELRLERYPTHVEFRNAGFGGLYATIAHRLGGHPAMAARLGLAMKTRRWNMDAASAEVRKLADELQLDRYPTVQEFRNAGFVGLHDSIAKRLGGHGAMAARLGLARSDPPEPHAPRTTPRTSS